jgi:hypothetical protein
MIACRENRTAMTIWIVLAAIVAVWALWTLVLSAMARGQIARKAASGGRQVLNMRGKLFRSPFAEGLTPLGLVYRVTLQDEESERAVVKLYAYDPGAWFSRHAAHVRQYSGGVWRDA